MKLLVAILMMAVGLGAGAKPASTVVARPALSQVGGAFDRTIEGFQGFRQKQTNWCWAAVTETIYFSLTGAKLDQGELARIRTDGVLKSPDDYDDLKTRVDSRECSGANAKRASCNHRGQAPIALEALGASMSFFHYPALNDRAASYRVIRESLTHDVPVGMTIEWTDGAQHTVVIYGATFVASRKSAQALVALKIFDPWDGSFHTIDPMNYKPSYRKTAGRWKGWLTIANYKAPLLRRVNPKACEFLIQTDRVRFCNSRP